MPARYVAEMLDELDTGKKQMLDLLAAFRAGDAETVESLTFEPEALKKEPGFYEAVFWKRNKTWTERLPPFLDKGDAFIAVGVGHLLGGELSLPTLLAAEGYEVARVP